MSQREQSMVWNAGIRFGLFAFGLGFLLGTLRTLVLAPYIGAASAVVLELPIMLAACWWWAGRIVRRFQVTDRNNALAIALIGFAVLMLGEFLVGITLMQMSPAAWIAGLQTPSAQLGLTAQLLTVAMPLLRARSNQRP
jgi:hypothetical protein